jgi:hypothetical protein
VLSKAIASLAGWLIGHQVSSKNHLPIAGDVGVARDRQSAEGLAGKRRAFDRKGLRFRRHHRETERLRQIGA